MSIHLHPEAVGARRGGNPSGGLVIGASSSHDVFAACGGRVPLVSDRYNEFR
jgi:hypothetical protein